MAKTGKRVYMDFAAATPLTQAVRDAYVRALVLYGNASAPHREGRAAREAVTEARTAIARSLSVKPDELVFTSGGTEANSLAILGRIRAARRAGVDYVDMHVVTSTLEHSSTEHACTIAAELGVRVTRIKPRADGLLTHEAVAAEVGAQTMLVTLHHVQSEIGVVQPISDIARAVKKKNPDTTMHVDAAQSPLWLDAGPHRLCADLVSYDAQKVGGPKGVGILYRDFSVDLLPIMGGGTQERSLRPGTENVPAIVAAGVAFEAAKKDRTQHAKKVAVLRDLLMQKVLKAVPGARVVGSVKRRAPNNLFIAIPHADGDYLAVLMDTYGVSVTPRSACLGSGGVLSKAALELTGSADLAKATLRFSLSPTCTKADVECAVAALIRAVKVVNG